MALSSSTHMCVESLSHITCVYKPPSDVTNIRVHTQQSTSRHFLYRSPTYILFCSNFTLTANLVLARSLLVNFVLHNFGNRVIHYKAFYAFVGVFKPEEVGF